MRRPTARLAMVAALIWCGVTRRVRSTAIPLLILAAISLIPTEVGAGSITYNVVNYPADQGGYTVSGTITTNGATGTELPRTDITSWDIIITTPSNTTVTINTTTTTNQSTTFDATPTEITVATDSDSIQFLNSAASLGIEWDGNTTVPPQIGLEYIGVVQPGGPAWVDYINISTVIATAVVPEPTSSVLAVIGAGSVVACGLVRRRRAQRRPSDAGQTQPTE